MEKVFLTEPIHEDAIKMLQTKYHVVIGSDIRPETLMKEAVDCHAIITRMGKISGALIKSAPNLRVIAKHGIGVDNIDLDAATQRGVHVVNAPEANRNAVAEQTIGMMLAAARNFCQLDMRTRQGDFASRNHVIGLELKGSTVGIIGFGRIAQLITRKLKCFEANIIAYDRLPDLDAAQSLGVKMVDLDELYATADFINVHVPLDQTTQGMVNLDAFHRMKNSAYLINVSRGKVVDEKALIQALSEGLIAGAAIDVFEQEPPEADNPLFTLNNLLLTPHNAALTKEALLAMAMDSAKGVMDVLEGLRPRYLVNYEVMFSR